MPPAKTKKCVKCLKRKPLAKFPFCGVGQYRRRYRRNVCYHCTGRRMRQWAKDTISKAKDHPCKDCGIKYPFYVMQFDHVRGKKADTIPTLLRTRNISLVKKEIAKCDVVCANCHQARTYKRLLRHVKSGKKLTKGWQGRVK